MSTYKLNKNKCLYQSSISLKKTNHTLFKLSLKQIFLLNLNYAVFSIEFPRDTIYAVLLKYEIHILNNKFIPLL